MDDAKSHNNKKAFDSAKEELSITLKSIEHCDQKTYDMFSKHLKDDF